MLFLELLKQKEMELNNSSISIRETNYLEIEDAGHHMGMIKPKFNESGKLTWIEILIDRDITIDAIKSHVLLHELGHAYDYLNRQGASEDAHRKQKEIEQFVRESEFAAFEYSLQEAKKLYLKGECDILLSLVESINKRKTNDNPKYKQSIADILKTDLWKKCIGLVKITQ